VIVLSEITPAKLAELIIAEWSDMQSDNGAIWLKSWDALQLAKKQCGEELIKEAYEIAYTRYEKLRSNADS
jgi:hypothetical protein